ncbi:MAG TPA: phosphatase PAP2 family protein, partial [Acidimicrobiales bacterium]|nr:phosphatase PAP2 family protein [Acidimicrobiales bacterium]
MTVSRPRPVGRLRWWREVLYILLFYSVYTFIRNRGVATDSVAEARRNALDVIDLERRLGTFWEEAIQDRFLDWTPFIQFWNIFYGTAHFVVTVFALVYLFRRMAYRYPLWRNTLACTTGLALVGFAFYPLMPPRLLGPGFGFVDTLRDVGGLWSFDSGAVAKVSNQYAAMPSLHFAWSTWCALVLYPAARRPWVRLLVVAYPALTLFAIVVTANHYWLDAAGGAATLGAGFLLGRAVTRALAARGRQPLPETVDDLPGDPEAHLAAGASAAEAEAETAAADAGTGAAEA